MSVAIAGLVALGFYFHFRRGMSAVTVIRMYLTRVLAIFALVFFLIGIRAPFSAGSIKNVRWSFVVVNIVVGVSLGYCAVLVSPNK
jgi:hypothetical protein